METLHKNISLKEEDCNFWQKSINNGTLCRVCIAPADIPILDSFNDNLSIMNAIHIVADISISVTDIYPKCICKNCLEELKISFKFKSKCVTTDAMFRRTLSPQSFGSATEPTIKCDFLIKQNKVENEKVLIKTRDSNDINEFDVESLSPLNDIKINNDSSSEENQALSSLTKKKPISQGKVSPLSCKEKKRVETEFIGNGKSKSLDNTEPKTDVKQKKIKRLRSWKCKRCEIIFQNKQALLEHKEQNRCSYQACPLCGKLVLNLAMHEKIIHLRSDKYTCDQCGKIYYSSSALHNHQNVHKETREFSCDLCPYKGKRKAYLVCHMRVHTGEHRYLCCKCPAKFTNPSNLAKHQLMHVNKQFECNRCKKKFRQRKILKEHYDSAHLNIRYRCSICGRDLSTRRKLLRHELRVHKREKHKLFQNEEKVVVNNNET